MPKKVDAELHICEDFDITNLMKYLEKRKGVEGNNVTFFSAFIAGATRLVAERPVLNRFIKNHRFYQRRDIEIGYVAKVDMTDEGIRSLYRTPFAPESNIFEVSDVVGDVVSRVKSGNLGGANDVVAKFAAKPRFVKVIAFHFLMWMDKHGWVPNSVIGTDPNYSTVFISNVGSIGIDPPSHHLNEWGTNSIFICIGLRRKEIVETENGPEERQFCRVSFSVDERIADGFYYAKTVRRFKEIMENPEYLEENYEYDYDKEIVF